MKKTKIITQILISLIIVGFFSFLYNVPKQIQEYESPNSQDTVYTLHSRIYLSGNTQADSFFFGNLTNGLTENSAYLLENLNFSYPINMNNIIYFYNISRYILFRNCIFYCNNQSGIEISTSSNILFENCEFIDATVYPQYYGSGTHFIWLLSSSNISIRQCDFIASNHIIGVDSVNVNNLSISNCNFSNNVMYCGSNISNSRFESNYHISSPI